MTRSKMDYNAHKVAFLVQQYPDHTLPKIVDLLAMPAIDINTAIWRAIKLGYIAEPDEETQKIEFLKGPKIWDFGPAVSELQSALVFAFTKLAEKETDMDEQKISQWCYGYLTHDLLISLRDLQNRKVLASYDLVDPEDLKSTYTFFTLYENGEQMWGRKQFEIQPTGEEKPDNSDDIAEGEKL